MPVAKKRKSGGKVKGKGQATVTDDDFKRLLNRETWSGWVEVESEPAFFNVMIRELGVSGVKFQEIFNIQDDMEFASLTEPVYALIFLFEYQGTELSQPETECPANVWFANQVPEFACASVAILNTVNNISGIGLGSQLQRFKHTTAVKSPLERGYAIDKFDFVRKVHNSFARELDLLQATMVLKENHEKQIAKQKAEEKRRAQEAKKVTTDPSPGEGGARRSGRKRKERQQEPDSATDDEETDEAGNHYVAYVPIDNQVWMMDGMAAFPRLIGSFKNADEWLALARQSIIEKMTEYEASQHSFNLMAMVHDAHDVAQQRLHNHRTMTASLNTADHIAPTRLTSPHEYVPVELNDDMRLPGKAEDADRGGTRQLPVANGTSKHTPTPPAETINGLPTMPVKSQHAAGQVEEEDASSMVMDDYMPSKSLAVWDEGQREPAAKESTNAPAKCRSGSSTVAPEVCATPTARVEEMETAMIEGHSEAAANASGPTTDDPIERKSASLTAEPSLKDDNMNGGLITNNKPLCSTEVLRLQQTVAMEAEQRSGDEQKAMLRRHDLKPFFTAWVHALKAQDRWDPLLVVAKDQAK